MDVRTCRDCKRIFNYLSGPILCPACKEKLEDKFQVVKKYIEEHRGASMPEVAEECDVDIQQIRRWLREERLELTEGSSIMLECESCGALIRCGKFCDKCRADMANNLNSLIHENKATQATLYKKKENSSARMRFLQ